MRTPARQAVSLRVDALKEARQAKIAAAMVLQAKLRAWARRRRGPEPDPTHGAFGFFHEGDVSD